MDDSDDASEEDKIIALAKTKKVKDKVVEDSSESEVEEQSDGEDLSEGGEDEMSEENDGDIEVSSSEDDLLVTVDKAKKSKAAKVLA